MVSILMCITLEHGNLLAFYWPNELYVFTSQSLIQKVEDLNFDITNQI